MREELLAEILKLSPEERIQLVGDIWNSIPPEDHPPPSDALLKEIERRVARAEANPGSGIPWETAKAQLEKELEILTRK